MAVLLASIGDRDPGPNPEQAFGAWRTAREVEPEEVVLVHTSKVADQAVETGTVIERDFAGCRVDLFELEHDDPTDTPALLPELEGLCQSLRERWGNRADVHVCATSATPQIGIALTLTAEFAFPRARHWTALDPNKAHGKPPANVRDRFLRPFEPELLRHHAEVREAFRLLLDCNARRAATLFERRLERASREMVGARLAVIEDAWRLASALAIVGDYMPLDAARVIREATGVLEQGNRQRQALADIRAWFAELETDHARGSASTGVEWAWELFALARREHRAGRRGVALTVLQGAHESALKRCCNRLGLQEPPRGWSKILERINKEDSSPLRGVSRKAADRLAAERNRVVHDGVLGPDADGAFEAGCGYVADVLARLDAGRGDAPTSPAGVEAVTRLLMAEAGVSLPEEALS